MVTTWIRKTLIVLTALVLASVVGVSPAGASSGLVTNGDFEHPDAGPSFRTFEVGQSFGHWFVSQGSVDLIGGLWQAASGTQSVDLNGYDQGAVVQVVRTTPGQAYLLTFALAANPEEACGPLRVHHVRVRFAGARVGGFRFNPRGHTTDDMGWTPHSISVQAVTSISRVKFRSLDSGCAGPAIDQVDLQLVSVAP